MAKLIYSTIGSLDGYIADESGTFEWAAPGEEVHAYVNDLERTVGTYLYGRRMYEVMQVWETMADLADQSPAAKDYAQIWRGADKIVYSTTLTTVSTDKTQLVRDFDADAIRDLVAHSERDVSVGGPGLAAHAIAAGLVDEYQLFLVPVVIGGGTRALPDHVRVELELLDQYRFGGGVVLLRYRTKKARGADGAADTQR